MRTIPIFCSFYYRYRKEYDNITKIPSKDGILVIQNISFLEENPRKLVSQIEFEVQGQINMSEIVITVIDSDTYAKDLINYEIAYAAEKNKRVIGVFLLGKASAKIPPALQTLHDKAYNNVALVKWEPESIASALHGASIWDNG